MQIPALIALVSLAPAYSIQIKDERVWITTSPMPHRKEWVMSIIDSNLNPVPLIVESCWDTVKVTERHSSNNELKSNRWIDPRGVTYVLLVRHWNYPAYHFFPSQHTFILADILEKRIQLVDDVRTPFRSIPCIPSPCHVQPRPPGGSPDTGIARRCYLGRI